MKKLVLTLSAAAFLLTAIACGKLLADNKEEEGVFEYRDIYLPAYNKKDNAALELDNVDEEWGIWGHNLGIVLPDNPSMQVYAKMNGGTNSEQFCFSSDKLYGYIVDYIKNNYLFSDSMKFAILPNDNDVVCQCTECVSLGNTKGNASPAVFNMIDRLAKKFPEHEFYTSYYLTTRQLPENVMAPNAGVLVSAMEYPLTATENSKELSFITLLKQWSEKTDHVYVWDYINNFDDYITPSPIFSIMQRRLKMYRDAGVKGVFLNGSGNDYSTFFKLKKAVLAQLLKNPDLDWEELLRRYAVEIYPTSGADIADFIVMQEKMIETNGKPLPQYEGVEHVRKTYLPEQEFVDFYNKLVQHKRQATGEEHDELETRTDALAFTMLELKRINGDVTDTEVLKKRLRRLIDKGVLYYNEGAWSLQEYLDDYEEMERNAEATKETNLLKDVRVRALTNLDEDYSDISILTDGLLGIPSNYHNGNLITSADPAFSISVPRQPGMKKIKVWMVFNPGFKVGLPEEVYISTDGVKSAHQVPPRPAGGVGHSFLEFDVPPGSGDVIVTLVKNPDVKTMALDEIEAF